MNKINFRQKVDKFVLFGEEAFITLPDTTDDFAYYIIPKDDGKYLVQYLRWNKEERHFNPEDNKINKDFTVLTDAEDYLLNIMDTYNKKYGFIRDDWEVYAAE